VSTSWFWSWSGPGGRVRLSVADGAAVRWIVGDCRHQYPSRSWRLVEALADRRGEKHYHGDPRVWFDHTDHKLDRNRDTGRLAASRGLVADCWPRGNPDRVSQHRQAGGWYANGYTN
jgi:hypothetical protein